MFEELTSLDGVETPEDLMRWAERNYNSGCDTLVECYDVEDLEASFFKDGVLNRRLLLSVIDVWQERICAMRNRSEW